jgi:hypothetical protein
VRERDERRREDLAVPEAVAAVGLAVVAARDRVGELGRRVGDRTTLKLMASTPKPTSAAPMRPPNSAWLDEDGRPSSHVTMFHTTAPMRPAKMSSGVMSTPPSPSLMMPPEMVVATAVERNAPTRLRIAARPTATLGRSAPVAMGVAIAFAVSWKPFVKSKKSASAMTSTTMRVRSTGVFLWDR